MVRLKEFFIESNRSTPPQFTFQYGKIKSLPLAYLGNYRLHLHSNMVRLKDLNLSQLLTTYLNLHSNMVRLKVL